jgi:hypothetical protein
MIVNRRTFFIKPGHMAAAKVLWFSGMLKAKPAGVTGAARFYAIEFGALNQLASEVEFDSVEECQRLFDEWFANIPPESMKELQALRDPGGSNEIWTLLE